MKIQNLRDAISEYEHFSEIARQRITALEKQYPETKPFNDAEKNAFVDGFMNGAKWQQATDDESEDKNVHPLVMFGWTCPRCATVHSPYSAQCGCPAPSYTLASSTQIIGTFCNKCRNIVCLCKKGEDTDEDCADCGSSGQHRKGCIYESRDF